MTVKAKENRNGSQSEGIQGLGMGERLAAIRGDATQAAFGDLMGVSQRAVSVYERGLVPRSWHALRRLGESGVDLNALIVGKKK